MDLFNKKTDDQIYAAVVKALNENQEKRYAKLPFEQLIGKVIRREIEPIRTFSLNLGIARTNELMTIKGNVLQAIDQINDVDYAANCYVQFNTLYGGNPSIPFMFGTRMVTPFHQIYVTNAAQVDGNGNPKYMNFLVGTQEYMELCMYDNVTSTILALIAQFI